jgi:thiol-disulfide isomerase/thioredoxin
MKMNLFIMILAFISSCGNTNEITKTNSIEANPAATTPVTEETAVSSEPQQNMIVGKFTKEDLKEGPYATWFNKGYDEYTPSAEAIAAIKNNISDYEIVGFVGTWCPDSRREIPKLYKILDEAGYDLSKLTMVGVTRNKNTPENLEEGYDMHRVPTFIFMKDGKEVNRFVEYAVENTEDDIAKIVSGKDYKDPYSK